MGCQPAMLGSSRSRYPEVIAHCTWSFGRRPSTTSSAMFITASAAGRITSPISISTPLTFAFSRAESSATSSRSTAVIGSKPSFAAAIESTPEPQPTSSRLAGSASCRKSRQRRVVACAPVPNARPGSITTGTRSAGGDSHGGPTQSRPMETP